MLPLNQNTIKFHNLDIHFYTYLRSIDKINFLNNYYTCSYLQSTHMILEDKTYSLVLSFVPILVIIWFYIYIDLLTQDRKDRDRTKLFVILTIGPLKENWDSDPYFYFAVSIRFFSPQQCHFPAYSFYE